MPDFMSGIHDFTQHHFQGVDARDRRGHDAADADQHMPFDITHQKDSGLPRAFGARKGAAATPVIARSLEEATRQSSPSMSPEYGETGLLPPAQGRGRNDGVANLSSLSPESAAVLDAGRTLWQAYFSTTDAYTIREELKLNRADVGWYQIRNALKKRNTLGEGGMADFAPFTAAYAALSAKLTPLVYSLGFLKA